MEMGEAGVMEAGCGHLLGFFFDVSTLFCQGDSYPEH
jgi:hypothetical protein